MSTAIKICGITNLLDANDAITAGAKFLGFIFVPSSERAVDESRANQIFPSIRGKAKLVGVFKDSPLEEVIRLSKVLQLDYVQLHGSESPTYCDAIDTPVVKVIEIAKGSDTASLQARLDEYKRCAYILFDKPKGIAFDDWLDFAVDKVASVQPNGKYFFAGGLNHLNVESVLMRISPAFVDVASGVEQSPGSKDMEKMKAFCAAVSKNKTVVPEEAMS